VITEVDIIDEAAFKEFSPKVAKTVEAIIRPPRVRYNKEIGSMPGCKHRHAAAINLDHSLQRGSPAQGTRISFTP
jgi:hypothetical protein